MKKSLFLLLIFTLLISCERDDICATSTETTPHLLIRFQDISNPDDSKIVTRLSARGIDENGIALDDFLYNTNRDSLFLPLRFQDNVLTTTRFELEKDTNFGLDEDDTTNSNIDVIEVTYTPELVYVSRACGYKYIFTNLNVSIVSDASNWILSKEIINETIDNETKAHVILRH